MNWKATEVCLEAGPQLVLQLYIIAFTAKDSSSNQGNTRVILQKLRQVIHILAIGEYYNAFHYFLESSLFANIVRVFTIVTSLLSLSFGFVTWRDFQETEETKKDYNWDGKDMTADMVWNVFAISARVITLALFAAYQSNWFWGLIGGQILVVFLCLGSYANKKMEDEKRDFLYHAFMSSFTAVGMVFNMFLAYSISVPFPVYLFYWLVMFIENTVMITLWYQWSSNLGLWYHDVAISCIVIAYIVSLIIKTVHCYFYNRKRGDDIKNKMFRWNFFYYTHKPNKNQDMTPKE